MKFNKLCILFLFFGLISCTKGYHVIGKSAFNKLVIHDTLINNPKLFVFEAGDSLLDESSNLVVKPKNNTTGNYYVFDHESALENDSIMITYYSAFLYDEDGGFRKNGIWVYTRFSNKGNFPFKSNEMFFNVDSVPKGWKGKIPKREGIYFYKNNKLKLVSTEQSYDKFSSIKEDGFYFFPNTGRLFERMNIDDF